MVRTTGVIVVAALTSVAAAQTPDATSVIISAAEAMMDVRSASYDGRLEMEGGRKRRTVTGKVLIEKTDFSDTIGAKIAIRGKLSGAGVEGTESFEAAYNGAMVRRLLGGSNVVMQADLGYGGEELLRGAFGALILMNFLSLEPYALELGDVELSYEGTEITGGTTCDIIQARHPRAVVRWYLGAEDRLPRKQERQFLSADGTRVKSELTLRNLVVNRDIDDADFEIEVPPAATLEMVGRKPPPTINVGDVVPDWTLTDSDGKQTTLSDYRGQVVLLDFWASWCPHCKRAMPAMQRLHDEYENRGVAVFGINCRDHGDVEPGKLVRDRGFSYPVILDGNKIAPQYRVMGLPAFFIIDKDGRLVHSHAGFPADAEAKLKSIIERHLN